MFGELAGGYGLHQGTAEGVDGAPKKSILQEFGIKFEGSARSGAAGRQMVQMGRGPSAGRHAEMARRGEKLGGSSAREG